MNDEGTKVSSITHIHAREVLDSRARPTVEVEIHCGERFGRALVPSGASTGQAEALELRDGDPSRHEGLGVLRAVSHVNDTIAPALVGMDPVDQAAIDQQLLELDDTPQKTKLGGNALLGVSLAAAHVAASVAGIRLFEHLNRLYRTASGEHELPPRMPLPMTNMISGGLHAGGNLDFQDVLIVPVGASSYSLGLEWLVRVYRHLGRRLGEAGYEGRLVGDEGGYGPRLQTNEQAVEMVVGAIQAAGLMPERDITIALDVAATHFHDNGYYQLATERNTRLTSVEMIDRLEKWVERYPITSIEDPLAEEDWSGWQLLTQRLGGSVQLVGDDLFTTNADRVQKGVELAAANSVLVKVNQIGTLTETFRTIDTARRAGYSIVVSARSGETEDATIAPLAVAVAAEQIKIGSIVRSERLAKYNELLRIEEAVVG